MGTGPAHLLLANGAADPLVPDEMVARAADLYAVAQLDSDVAVTTWLSPHEAAALALIKVPLVQLLVTLGHRLVDRVAKHDVAAGAHDRDPCCG
jgi:hypothetical protein